MGSQLNGTSDVPPPLPQPNVNTIHPGITLLEPLSRKGSGPGLIILTPPSSEKTSIKEGVPSALIKWAEEGYTVVDLTKQAFEGSEPPLQVAIQALSNCSKCTPQEHIGVVAYDPSLWNLVAPKLSAIPQIAAAVVYGDVSSSDDLVKASVPTLQHLAGKALAKLPRSEALTAYDYPKAASFLFATPFDAHFDYATEGVSHTRNLTHLKRAMHGPYFDLETIWDEHTYYEFEKRLVPHTMATMVQEPYVNHIPTITGGIGRERLTDFYAHHFVFQNPPDTELELISRTVGIDRVVDEFVYKFTHTSQIDWLVPGIPPTQRRVEVPFTAIVNVRGDRLYHEHIAWDQASVLRQLGLLPDYLPYPHPPPAGQAPPAPGKRLEYRLPVAGVQTTEKLRDKNAVPSNAMFEFGLREVDQASHS